MTRTVTLAGPLAGRKVLITRPLPQQQSLSEKIRVAGGRPVSFPMFDILPLTRATELATARGLLLHLDRFDKLIFVSGNAVRFGGRLIHEYWPELPAAMEVIAIGKSTASAVRSVLASPVTWPQQGTDSEATLALPSLQQVSGERVGIVRGQGGRELLAEVLRQRGAEVNYIEVYRRRAIPYKATEIDSMLVENACDIITVHSAESLHVLADQALNHMTRLALLPLVVPSRRVVRKAQQLGFGKVVSAGGADDGSVLETLRQLSSEMGQPLRSR